MDSELIIYLTPTLQIASNYQVQMMRCLREVNVDDNSVGWYQSTNMGNFMNQSLIEHQFEFQQALSKSVLIIHGKMTLQETVFRLSTKAQCSSWKTLKYQESYTYPHTKPFFHSEM